MNERTETIVRAHLRSVDSAALPTLDAVEGSVSRIERRIALRRRALAATGVLAVGALAAVVVWNTSSSSQRITTADSVPMPTSPNSTGPSPSTTPVEQGLWEAIPSYRKPTTGATVVWTGTEALMIGGEFPDGTQAGIDAYNPVTMQWRTVADGEHSFGTDSLVFWSGSRVFAIGHDSTMKVYDPVLPTFMALGLPPALASGAIDANVPWVWTGHELLVWPTGRDEATAPSPRALDPVTLEWRVLAEPPIVARTHAASVWTGVEWIVWGGGNGSHSVADGAAYNPVTDSWRLLATSPLAERRARAVWTGTEMLIAAGSSGEPSSPLALADGAAYDPVTDTWREIAPGPGHPGFQPVWTGELLILFAKGGAVWYDPATDQWATGDMVFGEVPHIDTWPVWTGEVVLLLGSYDGSTGGAIFRPPSR